MYADTSAISTRPPTNPSQMVTPRDADDGDIASVSTETEDDPVNLAMRATLGSSSVDENEHGRMDAEEEVIVWGNGYAHPPRTYLALIIPADPRPLSTSLPAELPGPNLRRLTICSKTSCSIPVPTRPLLARPLGSPLLVRVLLLRRRHAPVSSLAASQAGQVFGR